MRDRILKKTESLLYHRVVVLQSELRVAYSNMASLLFNILGSLSFNESIAIKWLVNINKILDSSDSKLLELSSTSTDSKNILSSQNFKTSDLGDDLLISILNFLSFKDRIRISHMSKEWNKLTKKSRIYETIFPFTSIGFNLQNPFCLLIYNFRSDCRIALRSQKPTKGDIKNLENSYVLYKNQDLQVEQLFYIAPNQIISLNISREQLEDFKNELKILGLKSEEIRKLFPCELEFISSMVGTIHSNIFPTIKNLRRKLATDLSTNFDELQEHLEKKYVSDSITRLELEIEEFFRKFKKSALLPLIKRVFAATLLQSGMTLLYCYLPLSQLSLLGDFFKKFIQVSTLLLIAWEMKPISSAANTYRYTRKILGKLERITHFYFKGWPIRSLENNIKNYAEGLKMAGEFSFWKENFKKYTRVSVNSDKNLKIN